MHVTKCHQTSPVKNCGIPYAGVIPSRWTRSCENSGEWHAKRARSKLRQSQDHDEELCGLFTSKGVIPPCKTVGIAGWASFMKKSTIDHGQFEQKNTHLHRDIQKLYIYIYYMIWLVVEPPLWKIWVRQLGWWHSQYIESQKNLVPNHQPVTITNKWQFPMEFSINVWLSGYPKSHSLLCLTIVLRKACQPIFLNKQMRQYTSHHKCQSLLLGVRHQGFTGEIPTDNG